MSETEKKPKVAYLSVLGRPRDEVEFTDSVNVGQVLKAAGVERIKGETIMLDDTEVTESTEVAEGQTLYYVPPVQLGFLWALVKNFFAKFI